MNEQRDREERAGEEAAASERRADYSWIKRTLSHTDIHDHTHSLTSSLSPLHLFAAQRHHERPRRRSCPLSAEGVKERTDEKEKEEN